MNRALDAPECFGNILGTSWEQIKSFSKVMPEITDQIIVLVNAKETAQIKENMNSLVGKEYHIEKQNDYSSVIKYEEA